MYIPLEPGAKNPPTLKSKKVAFITLPSADIASICAAAVDGLPWSIDA